MASQVDFVTYVCEQMNEAGEIVAKKMFGEYSMYCDGKIFGLICDNQVFIKPTAKGEALLGDVIKEPPYQGAKLHLVLDNLDDKELLTQLVMVTVAQLPTPKPKKKKISPL